MSQWFERFWHRTLRRPFRLKRAIDVGRGTPVVMLHGLGRMGSTWQPLVAQLYDLPCRAVSFDLLGFGDSPKPTWLSYAIDDHARAAIAAIERLNAREPVILVGHSMGCLISVRIARLRPDLVRHLVMYEMPLYSGLPDTRRYKLRLNFYFSLYKRIINYQPAFGESKGRVRQRLAERLIGYKIQPDTWRPFIRSLKHTIMEQTTHDDIKQLKMPMDVIYGSRDRLVIRGKTKLIFGEDVTNIQSHIIREKHRITKRAGAFLATRVEAALMNQTKQEIKQQEPAV